VCGKCLAESAVIKLVVSRGRKRRSMAMAPSLNHRPDLMPIDLFRNRSAAMPNQALNLLDRDVCGRRAGRQLFEQQPEAFLDRPSPWSVRRGER
jgi:hypothetical protein